MFASYCPFTTTQALLRDLTLVRHFRPGFQLFPTALAFLLYSISLLTSTPKYALPTFQSISRPVYQSVRPPDQATPRLSDSPTDASITLEAYTRHLARNHGVDEALALAVLIQESDPVDPLKAGKADSQGPLQVKTIALKDVGLSPDERSLPALVRGGILYLKAMLTRFRSPATALAAYNMGPDCLKERRYRPYTSTRRYVSQILARAKAIRAGTPLPHPILQYPLSGSDSHPQITQKSWRLDLDEDLPDGSQVG